MKKKIAMFMVIALAITIFVGCGKQSQITKYNDQVLEIVEVINKADNAIMTEVSDGGLVDKNVILDASNALADSTKKLQKLKPPAELADAHQQWLKVAKDNIDVIEYVLKDNYTSQEGKLVLGFGVYLTITDMQKALETTQSTLKTLIEEEKK